MDPRIQKMADVLVNYSVAVRRGDWVLIRSPLPAEPLAEACVRATLKAGGNPTVHLESEGIGETVLREASDEQLQFVDPTTSLAIERADVMIAFFAPANTRYLAGIDPSRLAVAQKAREPIVETYMRRGSAGELRWTGAMFPTVAAAQEAGMSLREYEDFVYGACLLDEDDPVRAWGDLERRQQRYVDWLSPRREVRITGEGTDLRLSIGGRTWINDHGHENFPGGEVFTGPIEDATEGVIQFNYPAILGSRQASGVRLVFEQGAVVEATAAEGGDFLDAMLNMDEGSRRLGEFAFGTNPGIDRFTRHTLFDEKIGGTLHMALGRSVPETGGINQSGLHWDMVYDLRTGAEVTVDGEVFSRNGQFQPWSME